MEMDRIYHADYRFNPVRLITGAWWFYCAQIYRTRYAIKNCRGFAFHTVDSLPVLCLQDNVYFIFFGIHIQTNDFISICLYHNNTTEVFSMRPMNISPSQALKYYYEDDILFANNSQWYGSLAQSYGLADSPCHKKDFANLISGNDLDGNQVIKNGINKEKKSHHRAAVDIPFSCPKSISIMALHVGDKRLIEAHDKSVKATIDYIEKKYIFIRQTSFGITSVRKTGESVCSLFQHSVSRTNDPQLHTHSLIINHTLSPKGHRAVWFDKIFSDQVLINNIYQNELAKHVKNIGYQISVQDEGKWEIEGIKKSWIKNFSKRSTSITPVEKEIKKKGTYPDAHDAKIRNIATLESRPAKNTSINAVDLKKNWETEVPKELIKNSIKQYQFQPEPRGKLAPKGYIRLAYFSLHETECLFRKKQILENSLKLSVGDLTIIDIEKEFFEMQSTGEIIELSQYVNAKGLVTHHYTSKAMKTTEQEILNILRFGKNFPDGLLPEKKVEKIISKEHDFLTNDQKKAIQYILCSKQQFMLIQGDAGTGKSFLFKSFKKILTSRYKDIHIQGLGFTGKAAQELQLQSGISSKTIASFLNETKMPAHQNGILIIDEASMLGSLQANQIFKKAKITNSKVIICGDCQQLQAISAGRFFKDLQELKTPYIEMNHVLRQKNENMLKIVGLVKDFQTRKNNNGIDEVFEVFKKNSSLSEIPEKIELLDSVVNSYLTSKNIDETLVITASNMDRIELNKNIRIELKNDGKIGDKDVRTKISVPHSLPGIKRFFAQNYGVGQKAFIEQYNLTNDKKELFDATIITVDHKSNSLRVLTQHNEIREIALRDKDIRTQLTLYKSQERDFAIGDKIIFLKNDQGLGVQNGLTAKINEIDKKGIFHLRLKNSKHNIAIDPEKYPWIDHSYAISVHKSQGVTSSNVILLVDTKNEKLNTTESLYVSISRAQRKLKIFTNDISQLKEQFKEGQNKTSTLVPKKNLMKSHHKGKGTEKEIER